jgi:Vitamin K-dependent gamma-carboxylase
MVASAPGAETTAEPSAPDAAASDGEIGWGELLRNVYLTIDRRTLGLTRILLGFYLILDLFRRTHDWLDMFSNDGILPSHVILLRPQSDNFSLFNAFSTPGELWVLWAVGLSAYVALLVGYKTKAAQIASLIFVTSMNGRVLLIENGGYVVQNLLLLWTCFMPLGDRFSLDAMLASSARRKETTADALNDRAAMDAPWRAEPVVSLAMLAVLLQLSALYFFNVVHKTGPAWKDGTAVHYVLYNDRMATPFVPLVRDHLPVPLILFLTKATMVFEAALPICLLSPLAVPWARRAVVFMMCTLHIAFGSTFTLGPFAWACCLFATLMFSRDDWEIAERTMKRRHRARDVLVREDSAASLWAGRLLARLDRFELLTFRAAPDASGLFEIRRPSGARVQGAEALADAVAALPLGPIVAWIPRLPGLRWLTDRAAAFLSGPDMVRWAGPPVPSPEPVHAAPSALARTRVRARLALREVLVALMLAAAFNQALVELWVARPLHAGQPEPLRSLSHKMRFLQGWFMFSPNPVMDDGIVVCDAETVNGRHLDPFTGRAPSYDLGGSVQFNQIWQDYMNRIQLPGNAFYRDALKAWLLKYQERTGHPEDRLVAARVVWIHDLNPRLGSTVSTNFEQRELLSFDTRTGASKTTP